MAEDKKTETKKKPSASGKAKSETVTAKGTTAKVKEPATKAVANKADTPKAEKKTAPKATKKTEAKPVTKSGKKIKVTQTGSPIGRQKYQRQTLIGLGLNKISRSSELEDTPAIRGMIAKVRHLVKTEEVA